MITGTAAGPLASLAHELRTPLHAIRASAELILAGDAGAIGDGALSLVGDIADAARRLDRLVCLLVSGAAPVTPAATAVDLLEVLRAGHVCLNPALPPARVTVERALLAAVLAALGEAMMGDDPAAEITARPLSVGPGRAGLVLGRAPAGVAAPEVVTICRWADACLAGTGMRVGHRVGGEVTVLWEPQPADSPG